MGLFTWSVHEQQEVSFLTLGGVIDEDNELVDLTQRIAGTTLVIDLKEVERINSCGVRDWVNWLETIRARLSRLVFVNCSPAIVSQLNLVKNFAGGGHVKSFYLPYFCASCDKEKLLLTEADELGPPPYEAPTTRCDDCEQVMDFDDLAASYFAFLENQGELTPVKVSDAGDSIQEPSTQSDDVPSSLPDVPSVFGNEPTPPPDRTQGQSPSSTGTKVGLQAGEPTARSSNIAVIAVVVALVTGLGIAVILAL